jgi:hypothetical protein
MPVRQARFGDDPARTVVQAYGIQPITAPMPAAQNKVNAIPAIQITAWGNLPDCGSILVTCVSMRTSFKVKQLQTLLKPRH